MNTLIFTIVVLVSACVVYILLPEKEQEYKYAKPIQAAATKLQSEIAACKTFEQLHAVEEHFKKCCDYYSRHPYYHAFFTSVNSQIQNKSVQIQLGMLAT